MGERKPFEPTDEVVKDAACWQRRRLGEPRGVAPEAYDRWLADRDARVRAQAPTDAEVEAAAAALVFAVTGEPWTPEHMPARIQRRWLSHARAALDAARKARS